MYETLSSKWDSYITCLPSRLRDQHEKVCKRLQEPEIVDICNTICRAWQCHCTYGLITAVIAWDPSLLGPIFRWVTTGSWWCWLTERDLTLGMWSWRGYICSSWCSENHAHIGSTKGAPWIYKQIKHMKLRGKGGEGRAEVLQRIDCG